MARRDPLSTRHRIVLVAGLILAALCLWQLERQRAGIEIENFTLGTTPVTSYARTDATGPVVVIAHGFAGSRQMMQSYALTLAHAGYRAYAFDFEGHGRNPVPMSGDIGSIDGTTQRLVTQTQEVVSALADPSMPTALLGHSMATDIIIRTARDAFIGPIVTLSAYSQAVTADFPADLLLIAGQWESRLRAFGVDALHMVDPGATEGSTVIDGPVRRSAIAAPFTEHVSILRSRAGQRAALDWLNTAYDRTDEVNVPPAGWWLTGLLCAIVALAWPLARLLPARATAPAPLGTRDLLVVTSVPALIAPLVATTLNPSFLPVLVADYLALHLALYGALQLAYLFYIGRRIARISPLGIAALLIWGLGAFGLALDRYGANFVPGPERLWVIAALCIGTVPFMLADAAVTAGGRAPLWHRLLARGLFLASLALAVALDFSGLFFLILIAPVILLFYIVFGLMGRWTAERTGLPAAGIGLGLILAWALGVSFPFFAVTG
jgi:hypothetical protein